MKSQEKVKRQRRIKNIPAYCDNPLSSVTIEATRGMAPMKKVSKHRNTKFTKPRSRRMNRTSK